MYMNTFGSTGMCIDDSESQSSEEPEPSGKAIELNDCIKISHNVFVYACINLLTLGAHAQRGLWYLLCVCLCVCMSVCYHSSGGMHNSTLKLRYD